ncbi:uncharacterized protein IL334_004517 [Kwoniella shivajii]|uniref:FAD dependent oxidoreductase domain-containing protein n=1 Tax=Kwoniella shivajii TaxID=564305 RepID=A0ABZ1D0Y0_9TREE|nr:hypothetical protein IL334_004517 [Kwoniella shivajii]
MELPVFNHPPSDRIIVVGAGIVGSCLASFLSKSLGSRIILIDRDIRGLPGSTGHAPGFVGQYNEIPSLTELAKRSVSYYTSQGEMGFQNVGGLEIGDGLAKRAEAAHSAGLESRLLNRQQVLDLASIFVREEYLAKEGNAGLFFPADGTANAKIVTHTEQDKAKANGAIFINADVTSYDQGVNGWSIKTPLGLIEAQKVVFCTGIWASQLLPRLEHSVVTVSHPYSYSTPHEARPTQSPFIRWPQKHVYARDHGLEDGLGSYAHAPIKVPKENHGDTAYGSWEDSFNDVLSDGYALLPQNIAEKFDEGRKFNGLFSVTPDGLPLVGEVKAGSYCAVGVWVTHAAGSARLLADMILGVSKEQDAYLRKDLDPRRFEGVEGVEDKAILEKRSLAKYNDIYNNEA